MRLKPMVFYRWQKKLFENGAAAFQAQERPTARWEEKQKWIEFLWGEGEMVGKKLKGP